MSITGVRLSDSKVAGSLNLVYITLRHSVKHSYILFLRYVMAKDYLHFSEK